MDHTLIAAAETALKTCLGLGRSEQLLVVTDEPCREVGMALHQAGRELAREAVLVEITSRRQHGAEPPEQVAEWFGQFDVAVMPTSKSLSHTRARREASARGVRIATLPGITSDMFARTMQADWQRLGTITRTAAAAVSAAGDVRITTKAGTDLTFQTGGRHAKADDGRYDRKGDFGNLPAGEAYMAPLENTANGTLVIDGSFPLAGLLETPLVVEIRDGYAMKVSGHPCAEEWKKVFEKHQRAARNVAEFGVGTLDTAKLTGNVLEDEKVKGTIHIAFGDNASMGGTVQVPVHLDGVVRSPSVWLDGKEWMVEGEIVGG